MSVRILRGHVLDRLRDLPDCSVHMVWTSVPYWGLRAYGTAPQVWGGASIASDADPRDSDSCVHDFDEPIAKGGGSGRRGENSLMQSRAVSEAQVASNGAARGQFCRQCGAWKGEHGLEPTLALWLEHEVLIWRAVRRVLRDDGTVWLNVGDAYATSPNGNSAASYRGRDDRAFRDKPVSTIGRKRVTAGVDREDVDVGGWGKRDDSLRWRGVEGLANKQRLMLPARLALALQADGWFLRDEIVWRKPNPMPSSVGDRTTPAHEMLYMLAKRPTYYYDAVAIEEPAGYGDGGNQAFTRPAERNGADPRHASRARGWKRPDNWDTGAGAHGTRNKRSVWDIATEPFPEAHFATAPTELVRPCILAGTSARGVCVACGAPWVRVVKRSSYLQPDAPGSAVRTAEQVAPGNRWAGSERRIGVNETLGWYPSCACRVAEPLLPYPRRPKQSEFPDKSRFTLAAAAWEAACAEVDERRRAQCVLVDDIRTAPAVVLDLFGGSFTTAMVADRERRSAIMIELQPDYIEIGLARLRKDASLMLTWSVE